MVSIRNTQTSFSGGIVSRELWSRSTDFQKLSSCIAEGTNFRLRASGSASFRSGTRYICNAARKEISSKELLVKFAYTRSDYGVLEFFCDSEGSLSMRFIKNKKLVQADDGRDFVLKIRTKWNDSGNQYQYSEDDIQSLSIAQNKNKIYILGENIVPTVITRVKDNEWTQEVIPLGYSHKIPKPTSIDVSVAKAPDPTVQFDKWRWAATVYSKDGAEGEAIISKVTSADVELNKQPCTLTIKVDFSSIPENERDDYQLFIYRVASGIEYFIYALTYSEGTGEANERTFTFVDSYFATDKSKTIPSLFKAFDNETAEGKVFTEDTPTVCGFHSQRLILGASHKEPNRMWFSAIGNYEDFTTRTVPYDSMAFDREFSVGDEDKIVAFAPLDDLLVLTESKIWRVTGTNSASECNAFVETYDGASRNPIITRKSLLYLNSVNGSINNFLYDLNRGGYVGEELDLLAKELFDGYTIKSFTFQNYPYQYIYAVRSDGIVACITYVKEQNVYGWYKIETNGTVLNVCAIPGKTEDEVYAIVNRNGTNYIECFERDFSYSDDQATSRFLDCFVEVEKAESNIVGPLLQFANTKVCLYFEGDVYKDIQVDNNGTFVLPEQATEIPIGSTMIIGYPYKGVLTTLPKEFMVNNNDTVGIKRRISSSVYVRVYKTRGIEFGAKDGQLEQMKSYSNEEFTSSEPIPLYTGLLECTALDESEQETRFTIEQNEPLPAFIQSITMETEYEIDPSSLPRN